VRYQSFPSLIIDEFFLVTVFIYVCDDRRFVRETGVWIAFLGEERQREKRLGSAQDPKTQVALGSTLKEAMTSPPPPAKPAYLFPHSNPNYARHPQTTH